jgi:hypothetical protein
MAVSGRKGRSVDLSNALEWIRKRPYITLQTRHTTDTCGCFNLSCPESSFPPLTPDVAGPGNQTFSSLVARSLSNECEPLSAGQTLPILRLGSFSALAAKLIMSRLRLLYTEFRTPSDGTLESKIPIQISTKTGAASICRLYEDALGTKFGGGSDSHI